MNVFDRLEAQLAGAHPHRSRRALPRPAPRAVLAFAAACTAVAVVLVAALAGGSSPRTAHPAAATAPAVTPPATIPAATNPVSSADATARVTVLNATAIPGLAGRIATDLENSGLSIGIVTNMPRREATSRLYYQPGGERTAALVAALLRLHGAAPAPARMRSFTPVVLVVGHDRIHGPVITVPAPGGDGP
jgi:hypothetical protein